MDVSIITPGGTLQPGSSAEYTYRFVNTGPKTARDLQLRMTYPSELINTTIVKTLDEGVTGTLTEDGNTIELNIPSLKVNQAGSVTVSGILNPNLNKDINLNGDIWAISGSDIEMENNQATVKTSLQVPQIQFADLQVEEGDLTFALALNTPNPNADVTVDVVEYRNPETKNSVLVKQTATIEAGETSILVNWPNFTLGQASANSNRKLFLENPVGAAIGQNQSATISPDGVIEVQPPDVPDEDPTDEDPNDETPNEGNANDETPVDDNPDISNRDNDDDGVPDNQNLGDPSNNKSLLPAIHLPLIEQ